MIFHAKFYSTSMKLQLILLFMLVGCWAGAQTYRIHGTVTEYGSAIPIAGAVIHAGNTGCTSDAEGHFSVTVKQANVVLHCVAPGYTLFEKALDLNTGDTVLSLRLKALNSNLNEVVVTASRFEQKIGEVTTSVETLKPKLIESTAQVTMETAVEQVSGVNVVKGQVNIRGGSGFSYGAGSRVMMLVDDLPLLSAEAGDIKWDMLPIENLQQVEVIKGASSALFGSSALGGVINLRTSYANDVPQTRVRFFTGVYDRYTTPYYNFSKNPISNQGLYLLHARKVKNHDFVISTALINDIQYRQDEMNRYARITANYKYHFAKVKGLAAGVNMNFYRQHDQTFLIWKNDSNPLIPAVNTLTKTNNQRYYIDPFLTYISPGGHKHSLRNRYFYTDNNAEGSTKNNFRSQFIFNEYQYQKTLGDTSGNSIKITLGAANTYSTVKSDSLYGNKTADNLAAYMQMDYTIRNVILSFGTRAEYFRIDTLPTRFIRVLRAGLNWHAAGATYVRASIGEGFRMPAIAELYASTSSGNLRIFPNANLQPENGWGGEVGIRQGFMLGQWKGMVDLAAFQTRYTNMIEFIFGYYPPAGNPFPPDPLNYIGFSAQNFTHARISGIEATTGAEGNIMNTHFTITGGYTYINPLNMDSLHPAVANNKYLKYRSKNLLRVNADAVYKKFGAGITARYSSRMINIDEAFNTLIPGVKRYRETHTGGSTVLDFRTSYEIRSQMQVAVIVKNILNEEAMVAPANLAPPRSFLIQFTATF